MPAGSRVHKIYTALRKKGMSKEMAARTAQKKTGQSLVSGRRSKKG
jgi:hypothetical protein